MPDRPIENGIVEDAEPLYATFPRRLNALSLDAVVLVSFSVLVFALAPLLERYQVVRIGLSVIWWLGVLSYEPLLVAQFGGTIGHRFMNLRVASNRTNRNVPLLTALVRYVLKAFLGVLSFFTMNFSRRHQAVHDILTGSSVRIRDVAKAKPFHYTVGRSRSAPAPASSSFEVEREANHDSSGARETDASATSSISSAEAPRNLAAPTEPWQGSSRAQRSAGTVFKFVIAIIILYVIGRVVWVTIQEGW